MYWVRRCLHFFNAARGTRRGGVCVFLMLQHVCGVEVLAFFECCKGKGVLDVEVFAVFECFIIMIMYCTCVEVLAFFECCKQYKTWRCLRFLIASTSTGREGVGVF